MKYFYITFSFILESGIQGTGYKVCACTPHKFKFSNVILELNKQYHMTLILYTAEISKSDFQNFSEASKLNLP